MEKELWLDITDKNEKKGYELLNYALNTGYTGVYLDQKQMNLSEKIPKNIKIFLRVNQENKNDIRKYIQEHKENRFVVLFDDQDKGLDEFFKNNETGIYISLNDRESMEKSIRLSEFYKTIIIQFESVTNIPLELILAYSQQYKNTICKRIQNSEDGWIASMTMEMGSQAVLLKTDTIEEIKNLKEKVEALLSNSIEVEELEVEGIQHIGMGDRVCIDTISKLDADEGMIIGSTSNGGILVSSENHYLPYMDLRPFRVNAGAIHSYVLCPDNKTKYLSELKVGDEVLTVNSQGKVRAVSVGRIKMEKRPMLLIKAISKKTQKQVNAIVQDDWHIRILSSKGSVKNSVLLQAGDLVLGYIMKAGRHLGVAIDETIMEK
ncbi:3-dehydroquinate synthase II [Anaerosporobacter faecicola]|uniref:3-dehydroquinate synthase II n=1 Tax=Anaerosporobacter faecicola TaxID=2718714 RepID=UPI00143A4740|nr:3-dehydroquinate synthase II [Anaerosporobacter faecicola]